MPVALALAVLQAAALPEGRVPLDAPVASATVYPGSASVVRVASAPDGAEALVVRGLSGTLDTGSLRVRADGAEVAAAELRERLVRAAPEERIEELRAALRERERAAEAARDRVRVLERMKSHLDRLLSLDVEDHARDLQERRAPTDAWQASFAWLRERLDANADELRAAREALEEAEAALEAARTELGEATADGGTRVRDLLLDLRDLAAGPAALEIEYVVPHAGWRPLYELRASRDLRTLDLVHRAEVWQRSGEDWTGIRLALSTSQPARGAEGPTPRPAWVDLADGSAARHAERMRALEGLGYVDGAEAPKAASDETAAGVEQAGLSVRYLLPSAATVESRDDPTLVLVGRAELALDPERYAVPAQDATVWVRGRTTNTTEWTLLPGRASVHVGGDFVGRATLGPVQPGEELEVDLGPDPAVTLERALLADRRDPPGLFGSRIELREEWRLRLANHRAEPVEVVVHEVLPRSRDERLRVSLADATPAPATDARWKELQEETGAITWVVPVPPGGERLVVFAVELSWPEDLELLRR